MDNLKTQSVRLGNLKRQRLG